MTQLKKTLALLAIVLLAAAAIAHWYFGDRGRFTTEPETVGLTRVVRGQDLVSTRDPAVTLRFDPAYRYLGGQNFVLYGVADAEQHFFIESATDGKVKGLFWIQYEAYLPETSASYDYDDSPLRMTLGGHEFHVDTAVFEFDPDKRRARGTDGAMARQFLAGKGYRYPRHVASARLVHLTDETRRKELMIIHLEDLASQGLTASALTEGDASATRRREFEQAHLARIKAALSVLAPEAAR